MSWDGLLPAAMSAGHSKACPAPPLLWHAARLQMAAQVRVPKWLETLLRIPGVGIIIALVLLPISLVRAAAAANGTRAPAHSLRT